MLICSFPCIIDSKSDYLRQGDTPHEFCGLRLSGSHGAGLPVIPMLKSEEMQFDGRIGWARNSGFQAVNMAANFGADRIVLVGFDMTLSGGSHWHGDHGQGLSNPTERRVSEWRRDMDAAAFDLERAGVEVINASPVSALRNYRKVPLVEAVKGFTCSFAQP